MGSEAEKIFASFSFAADTDKDNYDVVMKKFDEHFIPKKNIIFERARFNRRIQRQGESVEEYVRDLHDLAENCDFDKKSDFIRDRLVIGLLDSSISQQLQMKTDLTLEEAIRTCRHHEMVRLQNEQLASQKSSDAVKQKHTEDRSKYKYRKQREQSNKHRDHGRRSSTCDKCGYDERRAHARGKCPAEDEQCRLCKKTGHFAKVCRRKQAANVYDDVTSRMDELFMGAAATESNVDRPWYVKLETNGNKITFKLDTGADVTLISLAEYHKMKLKPSLQPSDLSLDGVSANISLSGYFEAEIKRSENRFVNEKIYVANHQTDNLLSRSACVQLKFIQLIDNTTIYDGLGLMKCKPVKISLKDDATPYNLTTPRRIPYALAPKVEDEIKKMLKQGVIVPVERETDWCSPLVPILKPNGKVRPCVDFRKLNKAVKRPRFMIPTPDEIYQKLAGSKIFTTIDATSGYWQIPLDEESSHLTTFITESGRYRFTRLPFGISLASETYQREMSKILQGLPGCEVYQDDVVIHGKTMAEHDERLQQVLQRIQESGMKLNREKCMFRKSSISFLGHMIDEHGIKAHPEKVKAVVEMKPPTNTTELKSFMGLVNYMSRYVSDLATLMST